MSKLRPYPATFAVLLLTAALPGSISHDEARAQTASIPLGPLRNVPVPEPANLNEFVSNRATAIALGKALFWDMQVGSDGVTACASCHFNAGADSRTRNQVSPGLLRVASDGTPDPDEAFTLGGPNRPLTAADFPLRKLADPRDRNSRAIADSNDVVASHGVFSFLFTDLAPGSAAELGVWEADPVFHVRGTNVRQVAGRNSPSVINAVFNVRNFWDGRAQNTFNGVNGAGTRDPNARVLITDAMGNLSEVAVLLENASLASQAVGPPLSSVEMSYAGREFPHISRKIDRRVGKKIVSLVPLGQQLVHPEDSVLGASSRWPQPGLVGSYGGTIRSAFHPRWWDSNQVIKVNADGTRAVMPLPNRPLANDEFTMPEYNFALFFGISVQMYMATLVANDTPLDRYLAGNTRALTDPQKRGLSIFQKKGRCITCHGGPELTNAPYTSVRAHRIERMTMGDGKKAVYDTGFYNIGVRPTFEDLGLGGADEFGNPLSEARLAAMGLLRDPTLNPPVAPNERVAADGAFKTPGLRNVELTAPYMHNGGQATLLQVVEFYNRGGDRTGVNGKDSTGFGPNASNLDTDIVSLGLTDGEKADLVSFLLALTDERVRSRKAPFDHPQLFVPNGHPWDPRNPDMVLVDPGTGNAKDAPVEIPAAGRNGGTPLTTFQQNLAPSR